MNSMRKLGIGLVVLGVCALGASAALTNLQTVVLRDLKPGVIHQRNLVDKINDNTALLSNDVANATAKTASGVSGTSTVVTGITASAYVTNLVPVYATNVWTVMDATTNSVSITNINTTYTLQTQTPTASTTALKFASGVCTNQ